MFIDLFFYHFLLSIRKLICYELLTRAFSVVGVVGPLSRPVIHEEQGRTLGRWRIRISQKTKKEVRTQGSSKMQGKTTIAPVTSAVDCVSVAVRTKRRTML